MKHAVYKTAVAIVAMMAAGSFASAGARLGATDQPSARAAKPAVTGITPSNIYFNASHASGGCALRNLGACGLNVSGRPGGLSGYNDPAQAVGPHPFQHHGASEQLRVAYRVTQREGHRRHRSPHRDRRRSMLGIGRRGDLQGGRASERP
jgi:hypothetical protein